MLRPVRRPVGERFPASLEPRHSGLPSFSRGWTGPLGGRRAQSSTVMETSICLGPQKSWRTLPGTWGTYEQVGTGASGIFIVSVLSPHSPPPTPSQPLLVLAAHLPTHLPSQGLYGAQRTPASPLGGGKGLRKCSQNGLLLQP